MKLVKSKKVADLIKQLIDEDVDNSSEIINVADLVVDEGEEESTAHGVALGFDLAADAKGQDVMMARLEDPDGIWLYFIGDEAKVLKKIKSNTMAID